MNSFRNLRLRDHTLPMSTAWLLNDIAEAKGKQELFTRQSPHVLKALREMALIQSTAPAKARRPVGGIRGVRVLTRK